MIKLSQDKFLTNDYTKEKKRATRFPFEIEMKSRSIALVKIEYTVYEIRTPAKQAPIHRSSIPVQGERKTFFLHRFKFKRSEAPGQSRHLAQFRRLTCTTGAPTDSLMQRKRGREPVRAETNLIIV